MESAKTEKQTLVEEGTQFKGSLSSSCPIVVKGRIEGDVAAPSLTVSASGAVHGKVKVVELRSQGELSGEFEADTLQLSGVVRDHTIVRAKSLEVKLATPNGKMEVVFGECVLDVGEAPSKEAALHPPAPAQEAAPRASTRPVAVPDTNGAAHSQPPLATKGEPRKSSRPEGALASVPPSDDDDDDDEVEEGGKRAKASGAKA